MKDQICGKIAEALKRSRNSLSEDQQTHLLGCERCLDRMLDICLAELPVVEIPDGFVLTTAKRLKSNSWDFGKSKLRMLVFAVSGMVAFTAWLYLWNRALPDVIAAFRSATPMAILLTAASVEVTGILLWASRTTRV